MSLQYIPKHVWRFISGLICTLSVFVVIMSYISLRSDHLEIKYGEFSLIAKINQLQLIASQIQLASDMASYRSLLSKKKLGDHKSPSMVHKARPTVDHSLTVSDMQRRQLKKINEQLEKIKQQFILKK